MQTEIKTWKTITIGDGKFNTKDAVLDYLIKNKQFEYAYEFYEDWYRIKNLYKNDFARFLKENFIFIETFKQEVELVKIKPCELHGLRGIGEVDFKTIYTKASKFGLVPCSQEVPWRLRIELRNDSLDCKATVVTEPFKHAHSLMVLNSEPKDPWKHPLPLLSYTRYAGYPKFFHRSGEELIFMKKKVT